MRVDDETRRLMGSIYSHRYYRKHREERNHKTRERMARLRAEEGSLPPDVLAIQLEARREAARRHPTNLLPRSPLSVSWARKPSSCGFEERVGRDIGGLEWRARLAKVSSTAGVLSLVLDMGAERQFFPGTAMLPCKPVVSDSKSPPDKGDSTTKEDEDSDDDIPELVPQDKDLAEEARTACAAAFWTYRRAPTESQSLFRPYRPYRRRQTRFLPSADLQRGERYTAADFSLTLGTLTAPVLTIDSSYDIACARYFVEHAAYLKAKQQFSTKRAWADLPYVTCVCDKSNGIDRQSCPYEGHSVATRPGAHC
ncbi:hypothetical protein DFH06DRAFT_1141421 [Mycena polygramma]|nr:hypothetical protein DFH06DRAFT_1141421 [Mycena polygramma]